MNMRVILNLFTICCSFQRIISPTPLPVIKTNFYGVISDDWACMTFCNLSPDLISNMPVSLFHFFREASNSVTKLTQLPSLNTPSHIGLLLLLLAGDVNTNPGPYKLKYPCGECGKAVKWGQKAIECENCNIWFHKHCLEMSDEIFEVLESHPSYTWICCSCGLPNFTIYFDISDLDLSNSFESLLDLDSGDSENDFRSKPLPASCPTTRQSKKPGKSNRSSEHVKVLLSNCRGIRSKKGDIEVLVDKNRPGFILCH